MLGLRRRRRSNIDTALRQLHVFSGLFLGPHIALTMQASFYIAENRLRTNFPTIKGFRTKIPMKLVYQYMAIFFTFPTTSNHFHPLQVENCGSNSRLVMDEDDNGKFRPERVKFSTPTMYTYD